MKGGRKDLENAKIEQIAASFFIGRGEKRKME